ncbi:trypsin-3 isoform X1 [Bombyx mori]|uniref:Peptidase S1 domain-containing protein n=1 Tax=Bombyx mori TaxID=7091 RepID=A0A8R1WPB9_BOMMO|nr:trypsin-3 [Bombyx mori]
MFKLLSKLSILLSFIQLCVSMNSFLYFNKSEFVQRVSNGRAAKLGDVPYQVAFKALYSRIRNLYVTFCGGVIIGPAKLISAAHCFEEKNSYCRKFWSKSTEVSDRVLRRVVAVAGNLQNIVAYSYRDSLQSGQWRSVYNIIYPTNYRFPIHDISIITLNHPFTFNQYVSSIPIASQFIDYRGKCLVSGYGRITETISSEKLLLADLEIISARLCSALHNRNMQHFVCTSDLISDVKKGDSGGPLVCRGTGDPNDKGRGVVFGIVSGNRRGVGSFFTRVSSYHSYIENKGSCRDVTLLYMLISVINFELFLF